jgi:hypothetical protein
LRSPGRVSSQHWIYPRLSDYDPHPALPDQRRPAGRPPIAGEIVLSHLRSIDALARSIRPVGAAIPRETARLVRAKLAALIAI